MSIITGYMATGMIIDDGAAMPRERKYKVRAFYEDGDQVCRVHDNGRIITLSEERYLDAQDINERLVPIISKRNETATWPITRIEAYIEREENVASLDLTVTQPTRVATTQAGEWKRLV